MTADAEPGARDSITLRQLVTDLRTERTTFAVLILTAVSLAVVEYAFIPTGFFRFFPTGSHPLGPFGWWSGGIVVMWIALPSLLAWRLGFGWRDVGLGARGLGGKLFIYALLYLAVLPALIWASATSGFQETYPLVYTRNPAMWTWRVLLGYWLLYGIQFVGVEYFFRGFLVFTLRPRFGYAAIAVMLVPYCMIHFHKPFPEAMGAIAGGTILGWLAIRTGSIWGGVLLHIAVAFTMDLLALLRGTQGFPSNW